MLKSYLKIFIRLFLKQTAFTLINVIGLAVGLACCLIIALYVRHELSFDRYHANADNLYRIGTVRTAADGRAVELAQTALPVATLLADNFPAVTATAHMRPRVSVLRQGDNVIEETGFMLADPAFFRVFDFVWIEGNPDSVLSNPTDVIVTRSFVQKYFGAGSALGKSVLMTEGQVLHVTGVIEDLPLNTHLNGSIFASLALRPTLDPRVLKTGAWGDSAYTYVVLRPDTDIAQFRQQLDTFARANVPQPVNTAVTLALTPVADIHLHPELGEWRPQGRPSGSQLNIAVFSAIGLGILLLACANFVNLSTARSAQRFREVGLRLTLGARRSQLLVQFLGESVLFVVLALVLALALAEVLLPSVQTLLGVDFAYQQLAAPLSLSLLLGAGILLGLLAGWYPALLLSGHKPAAVLKDPSRSQARGLALKNVLVVLQFAVAIGMLVVAAVIWLQMHYVGKLDPGYVSDKVVVIHDQSPAKERQLLKERLLQGAGVASATMASDIPTQNRNGPDFAGTEGSDVQHRVAWREVDFDYFAFYDIVLLHGRLPDAGITVDHVKTTPQDGQHISGNVVLNATGAREFGWLGDEALGKLISRDGKWVQVVGIVEDTIENAYSRAGPAIYMVPEDMDGLLSLTVKLQGTDIAGTQAFIERTWKQLHPDEPLTSTFIADLVEQGYRPDHTRQSLAFLFAAIAIVISCMGLFGLANFNTQRRIKEIGVRKVMGSSVWEIVVLLTSDFSRLVLLSNVIAWPVAYYAMHNWLQNFAYRIDLTPLIFVGSGLIALCIAWVTVGGTTAKAANQKPVLALRYE